jgi:hypothetical protein
MTINGVVTVLELDGPRMTAACASVTRDKIEIKQWLSAVRPDTVAADDAKAVGAWVGSELERAKIPSRKVVLSVSRGDVVLKTLQLPLGPAASEADMAGAVRLAMSRQLTMAIEGSAIDYAAMSRGGEAPATPASGEDVMRAVMAGAMPADRVRWCREMADAAGLKLRRIGLRCFGASALLAELSQRKGGTAIGIAMGWGSTEFVIVEDGQMVFARATDTPRPVSRAEVESFAERIAVETRRTWMSHKGAKPSAELEMVAILGEGELLRKVGEKVGAAMETRWEIVGTPALVEIPAAMPEAERSATAPLIGLLVEQALRGPMLDFANPRKLPDRGARRRQVALATVLVLIVFGGFGYVLAQQRLAELKDTLKSAQKQETELRKDYDKYLIEQARSRHLEEWSQTGVDWLAHIAALSEQMPDPKLAVVDDLSGTLASDVFFVPRSRTARYPDGVWKINRAATFNLSGRVKERNTALELRGKLVGGQTYKVESRGADVQDRFSFALVTDKAAPGAVSPEGDSAGADKDASKSGEPKAAGEKAPAPKAKAKAPAKDAKGKNTGSKKGEPAKPPEGATQPPPEAPKKAADAGAGAAPVVAAAPEPESVEDSKEGGPR